MIEQLETPHRWGWVSHRGEYTNAEKPARTLIFGRETLAGSCGFGGTEARTCGKIGTQLTQTTGGLFAGRSALPASPEQIGRHHTSGSALATVQRGRS